MSEYEIDEGKTERLIASKRHNELTGRLDKLTIALTKKPETKIEEKKDDGILQAITELSRNILLLPKPEKPNVNVEVNQDKVISSIIELNKKMDEIYKCQEKILHQLEIMNQPKETFFDIKKNEYTGSLVSVKATTKYITPKAQA